MKNFNYLWLAGGLFLLGSCSSEAPIGGEPNIPEEGDGEYYLKISFDQLTTRAEEGETETPTTYSTTQIDNAAFVFYDADGGYIATRYYGGAQGDTETAEIDKVTPSGDSHKNCFVLKLSSVPASVACVINAGDDRTFDGSLGSGSYKIGSFANESGSLFMSSTKYYTKTNPAVVYRTAITKDNLFTSKPAAESATSTQAVGITVEPIVAKVNIIHGLTLDEGKLDPNKEYTPNPTDQATKVKQVNAVVKFEPQMACLTGIADEGYTIKRLPLYADIPEPIRQQSDWKVYDADKKSSSWVDATPANATIEYMTLAGDNAIASKSGNTYTAKTAYTYSTDASKPVTIYPFENYQPLDNNKKKRTNVVIAGKYSVTDDKGTNLADKTTGTFYLLGVGNQFEVYSSEADVLKAMGATTTDELEPDVTTATDKTTWSGWMRVKNKTGLPKCMKYQGGYGYYSAPIPLTTITASDNSKTTYYSIVRNHQYNLTIKTIQGMGIGIPSDDFPIIPVDPKNPTDQTFFIHMAVNVLNWININHEVEWK